MDIRREITAELRGIGQNKLKAKKKANGVLRQDISDHCHHQRRKFGDKTLIEDDTQTSFLGASATNLARTSKSHR